MTVFYISVTVAKIPSQSTQPSQERKKGWLDGGEIRDMCRRGYKLREDSRADCVKYWSCAANIPSAGCGSISPRQGAKPACGSAFLMGLPVKNAFALLLSKVTKHIPPQTSPAGLSLAGI